MKYNNDELFCDFAKAEFDNYLAGFLYSLQFSDEKYKKLKEEQKEITNHYPVIAKVLYDNEIEILNEEQIKAMIKVLEIEEEIRMIEEKELFYCGGKEFYHYLKKMKIL